MRDKNIQKQDLELFHALVDNLKILEEGLENITMDKPHRIKIISALLRLLICDKSKKAKGGLLTYLTKRYRFNGKIFVNQRQLSLQEYKDEKIFKSSGNENYEINRCNIITNFAQQDGLSHESTHRNYDHFIVNAILEMGVSEKTNPKIGFFISVGQQVLNFGKEFLKENGVS